MRYDAAMHTQTFLCFGALAMSAVGCGGSPPPRASAPVEPAPSASSSAATVSSADDSTTTASLPYDGGSQGTKLPLLPDGSDAGADGSSDAGARRAHEPGRGPDDIRSAVVARRAETRACFEKASSATSPVGRSLTMKWTIDPKGIVGAPTIDPAHSDVVDMGVVNCVAAILKTIKFAASPGGYETKASYPFIMHRQHNADGGSP